MVENGVEVGVEVSGVGSGSAVLFFGELSAISGLISGSAVGIGVSSGFRSGRKGDSSVVGDVGLLGVWERIFSTGGIILMAWGRVVPTAPTAGNLIRVLPSLSIHYAR